MEGSVPDTQDETGRTGLHQAVVKGDVDEVGFLLSSGASPNTQDAHLQTPLTLAAERGLYEVVKALAEHHETNINIQDSFGRTPLHWCAKRCDVKGAEVLIGTGKADVRVKTTGGDTALHWACSAEGSINRDITEEKNSEERSIQVIELLIRAGADVRAKNDRGEKPMDLVRSEAVLALLLSAAQEVDKQEDEEAAEAETISTSASAQTKLDSAVRSESPGDTLASAPTTGTPPAKAGTGWPAKQQQGAGSKAFTKQGLGGGASAGAAGGSKKKIVIKLKKKSMT